jgi:hypothetical protein
MNTKSITRAIFKGLVLFINSFIIGASAIMFLYLIVSSNFELNVLISTLKSTTMESLIRYWNIIGWNLLIVSLGIKFLILSRTNKKIKLKKQN